MKYLVNSEQMKNADLNTSEVYRIPAEVLMERAAIKCAEVIKENADKDKNIVFICGSGNNGGDGIATARLLYLEGYKVKVFNVGMPKEGSLNALQREILSKYSDDVSFTLNDTYPLKEYIKNSSPDVLVDAIFGTGLGREVSGLYAEVIDVLNNASGLKISIDLPSGISADDGSILGCAFSADITVTFAFYKLGHILYPGKDKCGQTVLNDIGITVDSFCGNLPYVKLVEKKDLQALLPARSNDSNKGTYGKILVIAGCKDIYGACLLAAKSAYLTGSGLVKVYTEESNRSALQNALPEAMISTYTDDGNAHLSEKPEKLEELTDWADVIVMGSGLGNSAFSTDLVRNVIKIKDKPLVLDADALNIIAKEELLNEINAGNVIITPHICEMSRLSGFAVKEIKEDRLIIAKEFAGNNNLYLVLKDANTVVATPNRETYIIDAGNNGMSTGGSGDVLSGIIGGFLGQTKDLKKASIGGTLLHGMAGDNAAKVSGVRSLMASDIMENIIDTINNAV